MLMEWDIKPNTQTSSDRLPCIFWYLFEISHKKEVVSFAKDILFRKKNDNFFLLKKRLFIFNNSRFVEILFYIIIIMFMYINFCFRILKIMNLVYLRGIYTTKRLTKKINLDLGNFIIYLFFN